MSSAITHEYLAIMAVLERLKEMNVSVERLTREVAETRTQNDSILTLVSGLAEQIRANSADEAALNKLADDLDAEQARVAQAVTANTPQEDAPIDEEVAVEEPSPSFPNDGSADADTGTGDTGANDSTSEVEGTATSDEA